MARTYVDCVARWLRNPGRARAVALEMWRLTRTQNRDPRHVVGGNPYQSSGRHRAAAPRTTAQRSAVHEDDTDEREPVAPLPEEELRAVLDALPLDTPAQVATSRLLEEIADRSRALEARVLAMQASARRWRMPMQVVKGVGVGGFFTGLVFVAQALISHGDARAQSARQSETVAQLEAAVKQLVRDQAQDRAQLAADHALLVYLSARLGAPSNPAPSAPPGTP